MLQGLDPLLHTDEALLHTEFVERFYTLITRSIHPPYAISIDGLWGTGKTAIMRSLQEQLEQAGYPIFWFNPWKYRQTESVVLAFLHSLYLTAADTQFLADMHKNGATILQMLLDSGIDAGLKILTNNTFSLKALLTSFDPSTDSTALTFENYQEAIKAIEQEFVALLLGISRYHNNKPVIIVVDDLDRCPPADVVHFLEALKNVFTTRGSKAIFICGIDTRVARQYISTQYHCRSEAFIDNYFRRIFPLTLSMPYSASIKGVLLQYIRSLYDWEDPDEQKAKSLARMVYIRGLQSHIYSVRKYLNVVTNFHTFIKKEPEYEFQVNNDFVTTLFILKEAWQPLYARLVDEVLSKHCSMEQLIQRFLQQNRLDAAQEKFMTAYLGKNTPFAKEQLATWLEKYPMLA